MPARCRPQYAACSAALLALSVAACLGGTVAGSPGAAQDRRLSAETDEAVASFMACLNEAAKTLAGLTAVVGDERPPAFALPLGSFALLATPGDSPIVRVPLHISRLNLPPPAALS